jgi:hypothetical protein
MISKRQNRTTVKNPDRTVKKSILYLLQPVDAATNHSQDEAVLAKKEHAKSDHASLRL